MKEIKEDLNKWIIFPCSWIRRLNILKMAILPKVIYKFSVILTIFPAGFVEIDKLIPKFIMEFQGTPNNQKSLEKKTKVGGLYTSRFQNLIQSNSNQHSVVLA